MHLNLLINSTWKILNLTLKIKKEYFTQNTFSNKKILLGIFFYFRPFLLNFWTSIAPIFNFWHFLALIISPKECQTRVNARALGLFGSWWAPNEGTPAALFLFTFFLFHVFLSKLFHSPLKGKDLAVIHSLSITKKITNVFYFTS